MWHYSLTPTPAKLQQLLPPPQNCSSFTTLRKSSYWMTLLLTHNPETLVFTVILRVCQRQEVAAALSFQKGSKCCPIGVVIPVAGNGVGTLGFYCKLQTQSDTCSFNLLLKEIAGRNHSADWNKKRSQKKSHCLFSSPQVANLWDCWERWFRML